MYYKIFRAVFGFFVIKIKCDEKKASEILNTLSDKKIYFFGVSPFSEGELFIKGSVFSAGDIVSVANQLGAETEIVKRSGLPFVFDKYKKRYGILCGVLLAWLFLFFSSLFVWEVDVSQRNGEDPQKISALLKECGLDMGTFLPTLDVRQVENLFLLNNPQYSFVAININGTIAHIELRLALKKDLQEDKSLPSDVIAKEEGTIISVEAFGGSPAVKKGDFVKKGDLLISGTMTGSFGVTRLVHAYGKVTAAVEREYSIQVPFEIEESVESGRIETKKSIQILGIKIPLYAKESVNFEKYRIESSKKRVVFLGIKLPVVVEKSVFHEETRRKTIRSKEEAAEIAKKEIENWKDRTLQNNLISESISETSFNEQECLVTIKALVKENIGKTLLYE